MLSLTFPSSASYIFHSSLNTDLNRKNLAYLGVISSATLITVNIDITNYSIIKLILATEGNIIGSTECINIQSVNMWNVYGKYSGVDYQGVVVLGDNKIESAIVSHNSVAMYVYGCN